jgi:hypothetical protein
MNIEKSAITIEELYISKFNSTFTIHDILTRNGYQPVLNGQSKILFNNAIPFNRYVSPTLKCITIKQRKKDNTIYVEGIESIYQSHTFPLPKDAFDCYCILECHGDVNHAVHWQDNPRNIPACIKDQDYRVFNELIKKHNWSVGNTVVPHYKQPVPYTFMELNKPFIDTILDGTAPYFSTDLTQYINQEHIINHLTSHVSYECDLPKSTIFLIGLGVFSGMTCRKWVVEYPDGGKLPTCLYVVAEQPSGTSKTRALSSFQKPFVELIKKSIAELEADIALAKPIKDNQTNALALQSQEEELSRLHNLMPTTNTTPEALEMSLIASKGFFSAVSSEQGLFNSLLGFSYGGKKGNNNDILLNGRDAGFVKVGRAGRASYSGHVTGNIVCFAQEGSIEKVIDASNGTGVSERFLMLAEQHLLGSRNHLKPLVDNKPLFDEYTKKCKFVTELAKHQPVHDELISLTIKDEDWLKINQYKNEIEPYLTDGYDLSHNVLRGAVNKVSMQIMGIAANLHLLEDGGTNLVIDSKHIDSAISIIRDLVQGMFYLCVKKGLVGKQNEFKVILKMYVGKDDKFSLTEQEIKKHCSEVNPFKNYPKKSEAIKYALDEMVRFGLLIWRESKYSLNGKI